MGWIRGLMPLALSAIIIVCALGFVRYYKAYEDPGVHWAPGAPVAGQLAYFHADLGRPGDYTVQVDKLRSKFPLLFVEYQKPGVILRTRFVSPDGRISLAEQFVDEGEYRIRIQRVVGGVLAPALEEVFRVQTPITKYSVDILLAILLFFGGYASGGHAGNAYGLWRRGCGMGARHGAANKVPLNMGLKVAGSGPLPDHLLFDLNVIHEETGRPVLFLSGILDADALSLDYVPPDGAAYRLRMRVASTAESHTSLVPVTLTTVMSADAIRPGALRQWTSFVILMLPALAGMGLGWRRRC